MLRTHVYLAVGHRRLDQLQAEHVGALLRTMAEKGLGRNTIKRVRSVLVMAFTHAERRNMIPRNPPVSRWCPQPRAARPDH